MATIKLFRNMSFGIAHPISDTEEGRNTIPAISLHVCFPFDENASERSSLPNMAVMYAGANDAIGEQTNIENMYYNLIRKN